jgi:hypothetical protein
MTENSAYNNDKINKCSGKNILNSIDVDKITSVVKKQRGRPKKNQNYKSTHVPKIKQNMDEDNDEDDEIILHLQISKSEMLSYKNSEITVEDINSKLNDNMLNNTDDSDNETNNVKEKTFSNDMFLKHYGILIKKLKEENDELKKYLTDITPMYFTEVKVYPLDLKVFDMQSNSIIPKKTNTCCWWCTYQFDTLPTFLPEKYCDGSFYVSGCFCTFNCAGAYNLNLNDSKIWERYSLLKQLYYIVNKDKINSIIDIEINIAGPKELLEKYGGPMKIEDYRKNSKILGREYHKLIPPFMPVNISFEETTNSKINNKNVTINNLLHSNSKTDNIVIKRNKPLSNIASKYIDSFIE